MRSATLRQPDRMLPTVRGKEGGFMQDGNRVPDPVCGPCKEKLEMAVRTEAGYHDGFW